MEKKSKWFLIIIVTAIVSFIAGKNSRPDRVNTTSVENLDVKSSVSASESELKNEELKKSENSAKRSVSHVKTNADGSKEETSIEESVFASSFEVTIEHQKMKLEQQEQTIQSQLKTISEIKNNVLRVNALMIWDNSRRMIEAELNCNYGIHACALGMNQKNDWRIGYGIGFSL